MNSNLEKLVQNLSDDDFKYLAVSEKRLIGYIFEVDLEYPDELHALHNDYSLAPQKRAIAMTCCQIIVKKLQRQIWNKSW